jgi:hypothetical protein
LIGGGHAYLSAPMLVAALDGVTHPPGVYPGFADVERLS